MDLVLYYFSSIIRFTADNTWSVMVQEKFSRWFGLATQTFSTPPLFRHYIIAEFFHYLAIPRSGIHTQAQRHFHLFTKLMLLFLEQAHKGKSRLRFCDDGDILLTFMSVDISICTDISLQDNEEKSTWMNAPFISIPFRFSNYPRMIKVIRYLNLISL